MNKKIDGFGLGQMPGMNGSPVNPSFRQGPEEYPPHRPWIGPLAYISCAVVLVVIIILFTK